MPALQAAIEGHRRFQEPITQCVQAVVEPTPAECASRPRDFQSLKDIGSLAGQDFGSVARAGGSLSTINGHPYIPTRYPRNQQSGLPFCLYAMASACPGGRSGDVRAAPPLMVETRTYQRLRTMSGSQTWMGYVTVGGGVGVGVPA